MKWLTSWVAILLLCGCVAAPEKLAIYMPGSDIPNPPELPVKTIVELPDGQRLELVGAAVLMDKNMFMGWMQYIQAMRERLQLLEDYIQNEGKIDPTSLREMGGVEF